MKSYNYLATFGVVIAMMAGVGCGSKKNSSSTPVSSASYCRNVGGAMVDQYNRPCNQYPGYNNGMPGTCANARQNPQTGQLVDAVTGQPLYNCGGYGQGGGMYDGYNSVPYYGGGGGYQNFSGCEGWSQIYGTPYIPMDMGNGQLVCVNMSYLGGYYPQIYSQSASYYYTQPIYVCTGWDCGGGYDYGYGGGGYDYGYDYGYGYGGGGCSSSMSLGLFTQNFGMNFGICN